MTAHYGLGYTLIDLGRPREAFGHLAMYTEICPRNAWAWAFRGRAAHRMGETAEARLAYQAALGYEAAGSMETNAAIWLAELDAETSDHTGAAVTTILPQPPATVTARFTEALEYARAHHADQRRKGTTIPYVSHLLAVSAIVLEHGGSETAAIGALLHDVVEDGGGERALAEIAERFGPEVAAIVVGCSDTTSEHKEDWTLRKHRYLAHLEVAEPDVLLVSCADKLHNARSILSDLREHGDGLWERFNRGAARAALVLRSAARRVPAPPARPAGRRAGPHRARDRTPRRPAGPRRLARAGVRVLVDHGRRIRRLHRLARLSPRRRGHRRRAAGPRRRRESTAISTRRAISRPRSRSSSTGCGSNTGSRTSGRG